MKQSEFQFTKPKVIECSFKSNLDIEDTEEFEYKISTTVDINRNENEDKAVVTLQLGINKDSKENGFLQNQAFRLEILIFALFRWNETLEEEQIKSLLKINAPALLLSYARPIVSSISGQAGVNYDIPFMNFTQEQE